MRKTIILIGVTIILTYFAMIFGTWYGGEGAWRDYIWDIIFFFGIAVLVAGAILKKK